MEPTYDTYYESEDQARINEIKEEKIQYIKQYYTRYNKIHSHESLEF